MSENAKNVESILPSNSVDSLVDAYIQQAADTDTVSDSISTEIDSDAPNNSSQFLKRSSPDKWTLEWDESSKEIDLKSFWEGKPSSGRELSTGVKGLLLPYFHLNASELEKEAMNSDALSENELEERQIEVQLFKTVFQCVKDLVEAFFHPTIVKVSEVAAFEVFGWYNLAYGITDPRTIAKKWRQKLKTKDKDHVGPSMAKPFTGKPVQQLRDSFNKPYQDVDGKMKTFLGKALLNYAEDWTLDTYYSPYTTVAQSSGSGKSRTVKELGEGENATISVFFICFRKLSSSGYPLRSYVADFLTSKLLTLIDYNLKIEAETWIIVFSFYCAFLNACIFQFKHQVQNGKDWKKWLKSQYQDDDQNSLMGNAFWKPILRESLSILEYIVQAAKNKINGQDHLFGMTLVRYSASMLQKTAFELRKATASMDIQLVLFAFDEASELIDAKCDDVSYFHYLRYALASFPSGVSSRRPASVDPVSNLDVQQTEDASDARTERALLAKYDGKMNFFAVMIDTQTRIADFSPAFLKDPSLRYVMRSELYQPLYLIGWWNSNLPSMKSWTRAILTVEHLEAFMDEHAIKAGRYLWQSLGKDIKGCISTAEAKLLCAHKFETSALTEEQAMALLGARYSVFFNCTAQFLPELCKSHLATVYYIDLEKSKNPSSERMIIVGYPSEPIVALTSARLSFIHRKDLPKKLIQILNKQIKKGAVEAGYRGELAARMLLLLARDLAVMEPSETEESGKAYTHRHIFTVEKFLKTLGGEEFAKLVEDSKPSAEDKKKFMQGFLSFNHFVYVTDKVSVDDMEIYFSRGAAIFCRRGQTGCDR